MWFGNFFRPHRTPRVWLGAALGLRAPGSKTQPRVRGLVLQPSPLSRSQVGGGIWRPPEERAETFRDTHQQNSLPSPSPFELACIWVEKNPFLNLKLAKCQSANTSGLIFPCTNWNIHLYSSSLKVELTSTYLNSTD